LNQPSITPSGGSQPAIAAVVPALNEAPSIVRVVSGLRALASPALDAVIVVDNGSTDGTGALAREAGAIVVREERRGYGYACLAGVRAADADIVVLLDGDAADDPTDLDAVLAPLLRDEADLVVGSRALGSREAGSMTPVQVFGNKVAATLMGPLYGVTVSDLGPLRAIRRDKLMALGMTEMSYGWSVEMAVKAFRAGYRYREVPVSYHRRIGVSKVSGTLRGSVRAGWCILSTTLRYARWTPDLPITVPGARA